MIFNPVKKFQKIFKPDNKSQKIFKPGNKPQKIFNPDNKSQEIFNPDNKFRFSELPEDVGMLIFQLIAEADGETGRSCALVSQKVNAWVEPILFRNIAIRDDSQLATFHRQYIRSSKWRKPRQFFELHVKSLILVFGALHKSYDSDFVVAMAILKLCSNVETLALPGFFSHVKQRNALRDLQKFMTSPGLSPRRLYIGSTLFPRKQLHFSHPIFQRVTHLEFLRWVTHSEKWGWSTLRCLTHLTHLSLLFEPNREGACCKWAGRISTLCSQHLRVFILWVDSCIPEDQVEAIRSGSIDSRLVLGYLDVEPEYTSPMGPYTMDESPHSSSDRQDFWADAEDIIESRRQAKLQQTTA
ncbi:hypothetical protein H1R20_g7496, partial [Candolleomyces eurysporus]